MALCNLEEWLMRMSIQSRNAMPDTTGSECSGKGRGSHVGQKHLKNLKRKVYFYLPRCHNTPT